jgi:hypothetical protein
LPSVLLLAHEDGQKQVQQSKYGQLKAHYRNKTRLRLGKQMIESMKSITVPMILINSFGRLKSKLLLITALSGFIAALGLYYYWLHFLADASIETLKGHTDIVWAIGIGPDGATMATGSADCTIRLWDLSSLRQAKLDQSCIRQVRGNFCA